jgi:hypothetical protein
VRQLNTVDTIRETLTESNTCKKILLALTRANDKLKEERKMKMNKKEQRMLDKVFNLDCYTKNYGSWTRKNILKTLAMNLNQK